MKKVSLFLGLAAIIAGTSCNMSEKKAANDEKNYKTPEMKLKSDVMTPEVLWSFGRVGDVSVSPDKKTVLYGVTYYNIEKNKSYRDAYTMPVAGGKSTQITNTTGKEYALTWRPDGKKIGFLSAKSGSMQLWEMDPNGANQKQISNIEGGISGFKYSSDLKKVVYIKDLKKQSVSDIHKDLPKAKARLINDLMYRHWDHWVDTYQHIFITDYNNGQVKAGKDLLEKEPWEAPMSPFAGIEEVVFTKDNKAIIYSARKKTGVEYTLSTNSDLYLYDIATGKTINLTKGMMGYDTNPRISPDGNTLAWLSRERDGYEADKLRLFTMDLKSGKKVYHTQDFDQNVDSFEWTKDGKGMHFISNIHATSEIYYINLADNKIRRITDGVHDYHSATQVGDKLIATRVSMSKPQEVYSVDTKTGEAKELSFVNKNLLSQLKMGKVEKRWVKTTDNKKMLVWVIYPPHFDETKKYPALLYCQGGPQGTVSQFWSYRWNFQMMAANGYIVVAPNRRGLPGFGQEWLEQISGDYGGQNMKDYMSAINTVKQEPYVDETKLGATGASYGGFSVYWLAGNHKKTFKAFAAHCGMFNLDAMYLSTEEQWFVNWDLGGAFWDKKNKTAQRSFANSPHKFVQNWDTPILVIHGGKDFRIPETQGMMAFNAAKLRGIPSQFLHFPEENHWVLSPQNGILWQRTFKNWFDKWLK